MIVQSGPGTLKMIVENLLRVRLRELRGSAFFKSSGKLFHESIADGTKELLTKI